LHVVDCYGLIGGQSFVEIFIVLFNGSVLFKLQEKIWHLYDQSKL